MNTPTENCPYCGAVCEAEFTDDGFGGLLQYTPYACDECGAVQMFPDELLSTNSETRWHKPGHETFAKMAQLLKLLDE